MIKSLLILLLLSLGLPVFAADAEQGKAVFDANCRACHYLGAASIKTKPNRVPALLKRRDIPSHTFKLSESETQALVAYLRTRDN